MKKLLATFGYLIGSAWLLFSSMYCIINFNPNFLGIIGFCILFIIGWEALKKNTYLTMHDFNEYIGSVNENDIVQNVSEEEFEIIDDDLV